MDDNQVESYRKEEATKNSQNDYEWNRVEAIRFETKMVKMEE